MINPNRPTTIKESSPQKPSKNAIRPGLQHSHAARTNQLPQPSPHQPIKASITQSPSPHQKQIPNSPISRKSNQTPTSPTDSLPRIKRAFRTSDQTHQLPRARVAVAEEFSPREGREGLVVVGERGGRG